MKSNILAFFLSIGSVALAVLIFWLYSMTDRDAPEMRFMAMELIYDSETTENALLGGVVAMDAVDGDITDRVVVEKTILDEEQETAVVYYAVSDLSGNVTKQSRVFPADIEDLKGDDELTDMEEGMYPDGLFIEGAETEGEPLDEEGSEAFGDTESAGEGTSEEGAATGESGTENTAAGN